MKLIRKTEENTLIFEISKNFFLSILYFLKIPKVLIYFIINGKIFENKILDKKVINNTNNKIKIRFNLSKKNKAVIINTTFDINPINLSQKT